MNFWLSDALVDTLSGVATRFLPVWLICLGSNGRTPLYLNRQKCVNIIFRKSACPDASAPPRQRVRVCARRARHSARLRQSSTDLPVSAFVRCYGDRKLEIFPVTKIFMVSALRSDEASVTVPGAV